MYHSNPVAGLGGAAKWKGNLLQHAADVFSRRGADLQALIYGQRAVIERDGAAQHPAQRSSRRDAGSDDEELFAPRRPGDAQAAAAASGVFGCMLMVSAVVCRWGLLSIQRLCACLPMVSR